MVCLFFIGINDIIKEILINTTGSSLCEDDKHTNMSYKHHLQKEIFEQKDVVKNLIKKHIKNDKIVFNEFDNCKKDLNKIDKIIFSGCGSSFNLSMHSKEVVDDLMQINCEAIASSEFDNLRKISDTTLLVAISQSGETSDLLSIVKSAKRKKAIVVSFLNNQDSSIGKLSDVVIDVEAGVEVALTATKSYTATMFLLNLFILCLASLKKEVSKNKKKNIVNEIKKLDLKIANVLRKEDEVVKMAKKYFKKNNCVFLGKGINYFLAIEASIKLKETTYIHAEGFATEEFVHGPIAIVDKDYPVYFFIPHDEYFDRNLAVVEKVKKAKGKIVIVTDRQDKKLKKISNDFITIGSSNYYFNPIINLIVVQLLAYHVAVLKKVKIDKPRNLSKFVLKK